MSLFRFFCFFVLTSKLLTLNAETVEIVSAMLTEEILSKDCFDKIKNAFDLRITDQVYHLPITKDYNSIKRYLVFNGHENLNELNDCPPEKKVLFMMEPLQIRYEDSYQFSRIYTWDDEAIDNIKYFKFYFPDLLPMLSDLPPFEERKLCTMIVRNWHATHRGPLVEFFSTKPAGELEFYGSPYPKLALNKNYKGRIPGINCGQEKLNILKTYRFCLCFENTVDLNGYITEKIFPCFAAGCIPIYWGAPNVENYIPKDCFIDYRDFQSNEDLYHFLKTMPKEVYENYLERIREFIKSDQAQLFSPQFFAQTMYEAVIQ